MRQDFPVSDGDASFLIASVLIGATVSIVFAPVFIDTLGRRYATFAAEGVVFTFGLLQTSLSSCGAVAFSRLLMGIGLGICVVGKPLFAAELSRDHERGKVVSCFSWGMSVGILVALSWSSFAENSPSAASRNWRLAAGLGALPPMVVALIVKTLPESPIWLAEQAHRRREGGVSSAPTWSLGAKCAKLVHDPASFHSAKLCAALCCVHQLTGVALMTTDVTQLIHAVSAGTDDQRMLPVGAGVVHLIGITAASLFLLPHLPRRTILFASLCPLVLLLATIAGLVAAQASATAIEGCCALALLCYQLGVAPLFWIYLNELFAPEFRATGASLFTVLLFVFYDGIAALGPFLSKSNAPGFFAAFAVVGAAAGMYLHRYLPETKDLPLADIQGSIRKRAEQAN
jgi:SP family arabinose:H+ symporter-like MFS transporter